MIRFAKQSSVAAVALLVGVSLSGGVHAETLHDAMVKAYQTNPGLLAERAGVRSTDESVAAAKAGWRPTVSGSGSLGTKTYDTNSTDKADLTPKSYSLSVTQPLFDGFDTENSVKQAESNVLAARASLVSAEQTVLLDVATAYLDVLEAEAVLQLNTNNEVVLQRQLDATRDRFEVGELTRTDVAQAEASLSNIVAQKAASEGTLASAKAAYRKVVGEDPSKLEPVQELANLPGTLDQALETSMKNNPSLVSAREAEAGARYALGAAKAGLLPTLDLNGAYSYSKEATTRNAWSKSASLSLDLTVPLYSGGANYASIRQEKQDLSQARLTVTETTREVRESVETAWESLQSARAQLKALTARIRASEIALEGVRQEAEVGSRTTLDVLDAEQDLLDSRVALVQAENDEQVAAYQLLSAMGQLTAKNLRLPVNIYDPSTYYANAKDRWYGSDVK